MFSLLGEGAPRPILGRREFLRVGGLTTLGLTLPNLLAAEAASPATHRRQARSCLLVFMEGGPSHVDLFDMKPEAPAEVRGEFSPIPTLQPGLNVCELLPRLSRHLHRLAQVRSVHHTIGDHNAGSYYMLTGRHPVDNGRLIIGDSPSNFPPYGAVLSRLRPAERNVPSWVHLPDFMSNNNVNIAGQTAGFLGGRFDPFLAGDPSLSDYQPPGLIPADELSPDRLTERAGLVGQLDRILGRLPEDPAAQRMGGFYRRALELLSSEEARRAFDLSREPLRVRERYGMDPGTDRSLEARQFGGLPHLGQSMLLARRLLEAGVRLVTVITGRRYCQAWDTHRQHFGLLRRSLCPMFDRAFSAILEDLHQRGMLDDTLVVAMGEFGRTPKLGYVTSGAGAEPNGRDHWPHCYTVMLGGAGIPPGAIIGASDRQAAYPSRDPYRPEDIAATIYAALGIPLDTEIHDNLGRPHSLVTGRPIRALVA